MDQMTVTKTIQLLLRNGPKLKTKHIVITFLNETRSKEAKEKVPHFTILLKTTYVTKFLQVRK